MVQFFENIFKAAHREVLEADGSYALREPAEAYGLNLPPKKRLQGPKTPSFGMNASMK